MKIFPESIHLNYITFRLTLDLTIQQDENNCYKHDKLIINLKYGILIVYTNHLYSNLMTKHHNITSGHHNGVCITRK
jgi:hypothetical protein